MSEIILDLCSPSITDQALFGVFDNNKGISELSLDATDCSDWILKVENPASFEVTLTPIDNCISMDRTEDGKKGKSCDCAISYKETLLLVEFKLKKRPSIQESLDQITAVIDNHLEKITRGRVYSKRFALLANKNQRGISRSVYLSKSEALKLSSGFILKISNKINLNDLC